MHQGNRPVVPEFDGAEFLYMRYGCNDFLDGQLVPAAIHFPRTSLNRESLSEPEDVLFAESGTYNGLGVVGFVVSDIPPCILQPDGPAYSFWMKHVPLAHNYSHSEIWCAQGASTGSYRMPS